jgi:hypothetical protein
VVLVLEEVDCFIGDAVNEAALLSDSPRPTAAEHAAVGANG